MLGWQRPTKPHAGPGVGCAEPDGGYKLHEPPRNRRQHASRSASHLGPSPSLSARHRCTQGCWPSDHSFLASTGSLPRQSISRLFCSLLTASRHSVLAQTALAQCFSMFRGSSDDPIDLVRWRSFVVRFEWEFLGRRHLPCFFHSARFLPNTVSVFRRRVRHLCRHSSKHWPLGVRTHSADCFRLRLRGTLHMVVDVRTRASKRS
jgi:hypothetical protein